MMNQTSCSTSGKFSDTSITKLSRPQVVMRPGFYSRNISQRLIWYSLIAMPGFIDGLELAAKIHQIDPSLPVLFVTGALPEGDARAVGIVEKELLVRKPFSPKQLIDLVKARIRRF